MEVVDARVHIFAAMALGRDWVASPMLGRLYPWKAPVLTLQEAELTPGPVWRQRSEEKSPPLRHQGSNPGCPARNQTPCHLIHLAHIYIYAYILCVCIYIYIYIYITK